MRPVTTPTFGRFSETNESTRRPRSSCITGARPGHRRQATSRSMPLRIRPRIGPRPLRTTWPSATASRPWTRTPTASPVVPVPSTPARVARGWTDGEPSARPSTPSWSGSATGRPTRTGSPSRSRQSCPTSTSVSQPRNALGSVARCPQVETTSAGRGSAALLSVCLEGHAVGTVKQGREGRVRPGPWDRCVRIGERSAALRSRRRGGYPPRCGAGNVAPG